MLLVVVVVFVAVLVVVVARDTFGRAEQGERFERRVLERILDNRVSGGPLSPDEGVPVRRY